MLIRIFVALVIFDDHGIARHDFDGIIRQSLDELDRLRVRTGYRSAQRFDTCIAFTDGNGFGLISCECVCVAEHETDSKREKNSDRHNGTCNSCDDHTPKVR